MAERFGSVSGYSVATNPFISSECSAGERLHESLFMAKCIIPEQEVHVNQWFRSG